jgi:hypothetical protein
LKQCHLILKIYMIKIAGIFVSVTIAISLFSCSKNNEPVIQTEKLTTAKWYLLKLNVIADNPVSPVYNVDTIIYPQNCEKDDYMIFMADSVFVNYYGAKKCETYTPDSVVGTWSLNKSNLMLGMENEIIGQCSYKINELSTKYMVLIQEIERDVIINGNTETIKSKKTFYYENK